MAEQNLPEWYPAYVDWYNKYIRGRGEAAEKYGQQIYFQMIEEDKQSAKDREQKKAQESAENKKLIAGVGGLVAAPVLMAAGSKLADWAGLGAAETAKTAGTQATSGIGGGLSGAYGGGFGVGGGGAGGEIAGAAAAGQLGSQAGSSLAAPQIISASRIAPTAAQPAAGMGAGLGLGLVAAVPTVIGPGMAKGLQMAFGRDKPSRAETTTTEQLLEGYKSDPSLMKNLEAQIPGFASFGDETKKALLNAAREAGALNIPGAQGEVLADSLRNPIASTKARIAWSRGKDSSSTGARYTRPDKPFLSREEFAREVWEGGQNLGGEKTRENLIKKMDPFFTLLEQAKISGVPAFDPAAVPAAATPASASFPISGLTPEQQQQFQVFAQQNPGVLRGLLGL